MGAAGWLGDHQLFVNFLPSSIYNPSICLRTTEAAIAEAGVPMAQLVFEVVESEHIASVPRLRAIFDRYHEMGAKVALDDLGADHATFGVAEALRPDIMKIDGAIARRLPDPSAVAFVRQAVALADASGAKVLIEGVEDQHQLDSAVELGVDLAQGYLLGRPAPATVPATPRRTLTVRSEPDASL
ncbi:EAL domain-containing protein [Iamia sp. SCSIO 61187]|uniref:EAL domain-containing protein n=1 Tax=Iamia sp. SCSIO 61187 TaxID=2722752 RepID=UPI001C639A51|nr:EAL domain-containing protein [Iamia sp. SCSIO 61187]QYG91163.1 EAL domain-containing protein [Iamia sp. SCSIO 61187]